MRPVLIEKGAWQRVDEASMMSWVWIGLGLEWNGSDESGWIGGDWIGAGIYIWIGLGTGWDLD